MRCKQALCLRIVAALLVAAWGCTQTAGPQKQQQAAPVAPEVLVTVPKWARIGTLTPETPTVRKVLEKYAGPGSGADEIITANEWKYSRDFYKGLVFGARIFVSEEDELLILPPDGDAPRDVITKRVPNPEYLKGLAPDKAPQEQDLVKEETLTE